MSDIRITMVGTQGAGKTCFLLGMYAVMREGVRGFTFSTPDPDLDLDLGDHWDRLVSERGASRWPQPNDNNVFNYEFSFNYGFMKLLGFDWIDYRGKALFERASETDVQILHKHVANSDSLLLCVSGEELANGRSVSQIQSRIRTARMNNLFTAVTKEGKKPSIAVVVTKYDYCREKDKKEVIDLIQRLFSPLFVQGAGWLVTICPVSLGIELARDQDGGLIAPMNIHLPVTFALYSSFKRQMAALDAKIAGERLRRTELGRNWLLRLINRGELSANRETTEFLEENREQIEHNIGLLCKEFMQGATIYHDGAEVELDV